MTHAIIGLGICYEARNGQQLFVRVTDLFTDYTKTLEWFLERNGGFSHMVEPSQAKTPYGVGPRITHEQRIMLLTAAKKLAHQAAQEKLQ